MKKETPVITTMPLPKRLLDGASSDATREILTGALIDAENRCVVVTNGIILTRIPIPGDATVKPGYITPELWKIAKVKDARVMDLDFVAGTLNGQPIDGADKVADYPNYRQVIPRDATAYRIGLKPSLIALLAASMGVSKDERIIFDMPADGESPVMVRFGDSDGVLMPFRVSEDMGILSGAKPPERSANAEAANAEAALQRTIDALRAELAAKPPERSGNITPDAALDAAHAELAEQRARVRQLEAILAEGVKPLDPSGKALSPDPKDTRKREVGLAIGPPTITRNPEKNGIELRFNGKPDEATRAALHARKWKWSARQPGQPWYVKYSEEQWVFAHSLAEATPMTPMPEPEEPSPLPAPMPAPAPALRVPHMPDF